MAWVENVTHLRVRYGETDQMGTYRNPSVLDWFECGRTELMRANGSAYAELERRGVYLPLTESHVYYRARARYDELLEVATTAAMLGRARLRFEVVVRRAEGGRTVAEGHTIHAFADASGRAVRPPRWLVEAIAGQTAAVESSDA